MKRLRNAGLEGEYDLDIRGYSVFPSSSSL